MSTPNTLLDELSQPPLLQRLTAIDWLWAAVLTITTLVAFNHYQALLDAYEIGILFSVAATSIWLGWSWKGVRPIILTTAAFSLLAVSLYGNDMTQGDSNFFLRFLFSSQSAVAWMGTLFVLATLSYFLGLLIQSPFTEKVASRMTWFATVFGYTALMVRWRESYLIDPDFGHIPVSNLYEVFILFCVITSTLYLYYEAKKNDRSLGGFVLLIITTAVAFLLWYYQRGAAEIQPLVPALQSYWMKIHVPANFIGYGAFSLAAMVGVAALIKNTSLGIAERLPSHEDLDDLMYKSIALGFAFFTIATILGAMWAAEAWGGYWSWDPKETWALIVWLNYAAWLHMRLTKGWRGNAMAWWAIIGLLITAFAFVGVNMFLSGMHSYGEL